ncbi:MAG: imidazole glycerol phosphate synthase subunit HisH [Hyphomonadaceae bacterium]|nr:imidazole glycerol phosphate synthase subunit HisH [Hyphomonadaceae bacterium]
MSVAVIKIGVGNTASVMFALDRLGARATLTDDPKRVGEAERVILPGVGAAATAMALLQRTGLDHVLRAFTRPLLGICLGQQLLYERSEEGNVECLGLLPGAVTALRGTPEAPCPNMGWCKLSVVRTHPLFEGARSGDYAYFVHSYASAVDENAIASAHSGRTFAAAVARGAVMGCQFHPERSGVPGARVLANFLALPC